MLDAALVQRDGSFHRWLEYRGPQSCLLTLVDDATGRALGQFGAHETIWAAVGVAARVDCPRRDTAGTRHRLEECVCAAAERRGTVDGGGTADAIWRMCARLGIRIIAASSPQAKGRIERNHGTHHDRLVKKLRRKGIADCAAANAFLEAEYCVAHNRQFAQAPASAEDFHVPLARRAARRDLSAAGVPHGLE